MKVARHWLPRALGLLSFLWFASATPPGFYWLDSAELSVGGLGLGVAHPTGFPLYMMLIKAASLLPLGELSYRVNLLSALCAAFSIGGSARLILLIGKDGWAGIAGAVAGAGALCFTLLFARQATVAEIYAPSAALIVVTLLLLERVAAGGNAAAGLSLAWVAGLGFAVHPEYRLLMGLPIAALLALRAFRGARWPLLAPAFTVFAATASYLYLPVRSSTGRIGSLDWGHPSTFGRAWDHATGSGIRMAFDKRMMSSTWDVVSVDASVFARQILDYMGVLAVLAGLVGLVIVLLEKRTRWLGAALATIALLDFMYSAWINPMGLVDWQNGVPLVLALSVGAGVAIGSLASSAGTRAAPFVGGALAFGTLMQPAMLSVSGLYEVGSLPRTLGEEALLRAPIGAILLSQSDSLAASATYLQQVEGVRPDVAALVVSMLVDTQRMEYVVSSSTREISDQLLDATRGVAGLWATGRPVLWEAGIDSPPPGLGLVPGAVVSHLVAANEGQAPGPTVLARIASLYGDDGYGDRSARRNLAATFSALGNSAMAFGETSMALFLYESALKVRPGHAVALVNLGVIYSRRGDIERAAKLSEEALLEEPNRPRALVNAARYRLALGDLKMARTHAARAVAVAPQLAASWTLAGLVELKSSHRALARQYLEKALEIDPGRQEAAGALRFLSASD